MSENVKVTDIDLKGIEAEAKKTGKSLNDLRNEVKDLRKALGETEIGTEKFEQSLSDLIQKQQELTNVTKSGIASQKGSYNDLVNQMDILKRQWRSTADETQRASLGSQINDINNKLKELDSTVGNHQREVGNYKQILKGVKEELLTLEEGTEEYNQKLKEAAEISQKMQDVNEFVAASANDLGDHIKNVSGAMAGLTGAFQTVQATMNLFGIENEEFEKTVQTMQSLMAVTQGLTAIEGAIDPIKRLGVALKGTAVYQALFTKSVQGSSVALKGFSKALVATGIGAIVVAIGLLIAYWDDLTAMIKGNTEAQEENNKLQEEFAKLERERSQKINDSIASVIANYKVLQFQWSKLTSEQEKTKWIEENKKKFDELGLSVSNLTDADKIFVKESGNVIQMLKMRAKVMGLSAALAEEYKRKELAQIEKNQQSTFGMMGYKPTELEIKDYGLDNTKLPDGTKVDYFNNDGSLNSTGAMKWYSIVTAQQDAIIEDANNKINNYVNTISKIQSQMSIWEERYSPTTTSTTSTTTSTTSTTNSSKKDPLEERKKKLEEYQKWINEFNWEVSQSRKTEYQQELAAIEKEQNKELATLKEYLDAKIITQEEYDKQSLNITTFYGEQRKKVDDKYAKEELERQLEKIEKFKETINNEINKIQEDTDKKLTRTQRQYERSSAAAGENPLKQNEITATLLNETQKILTNQKDSLLIKKGEISSRLGDLRVKSVLSDEEKAEYIALHELLKTITADLEEVDYQIEKNTTDQSNNITEKQIIKLDRLKSAIEETKNSINTIFEIGPDNPLQSQLGQAFDFLLNGLETIKTSLKDGGKDWATYGKLAGQGLSLVSGILNSIAEQQDTATKEGFEKQKKLQIASATIQMLGGITTALSGAFTTKTGPWDWILAGIQAAFIATAGALQINQIKKQTFDGGSTNTALPSMSAISAMQTPVQSVTQINGASTESSTQETKVYVLESDISNARNNVKTAVEESTF